MNRELGVLCVAVEMNVNVPLWFHVDQVGQLAIAHLLNLDRFITTDAENILFSIVIKKLLL